MLKNTETTRLSRRYALQTVVAVTVLSWVLSPCTCLLMLTDLSLL